MGTLHGNIYNFSLTSQSSFRNRTKRPQNIYRTYKPSLYHILPSIYLLLQYSSKQLMDLKPQAQKLNSACWGWISQVYACVSNMSASARKRHFDSLEPELQWFPAMQRGTEFRSSVRALLTLNQEPSLQPNIFPFKRMPAKCINRLRHLWEPEFDPWVSHLWKENWLS